jgi:hypothetical protein
VRMEYLIETSLVLYTSSSRTWWNIGWRISGGNDKRSSGEREVGWDR